MTTAEGDVSRIVEDVLATVSTCLSSDTPERRDEAVRALQQLSDAFRQRGLEFDGTLENLPRTAARALKHLETAEPEDLATLLRSIAELVETRGESADDLERFAAWLQTHVAPILDPDEYGLEAEARWSEEIRTGARTAIAEALQKRGLSPAKRPATKAPVTRPAPQSMNRHRVFWRNFAGIAPALLRLAGTIGGERAATAQVSALLASLDLPDQVTVSATETGAVLRFDPPHDLEGAETLRQMLADAPGIAGWRFAAGQATL